MPVSSVQSSNALSPMLQALRQHDIGQVLHPSNALCRCLSSGRLMLVRLLHCKMLELLCECLPAHAGASCSLREHKPLRPCRSTCRPQSDADGPLSDSSAFVPTKGCRLWCEAVRQSDADKVGTPENALAPMRRCLRQGAPGCRGSTPVVSRPCGTACRPSGKVRMVRRERHQPLCSKRGCRPWL